MLRQSFKNTTDTYADAVAAALDRAYSSLTFDYDWRCGPNDPTFRRVVGFRIERPRDAKGRYMRVRTVRRITHPRYHR